MKNLVIYVHELILLLLSRHRLNKMGSRIDGSDKALKTDNTCRDRTPVVENLIDVDISEETIAATEALAPTTASIIVNPSSISTIDNLQDQLLPLKIEEPTPKDEEKGRDKPPSTITTDQQHAIVKDDQSIEQQQINCDRCKAIQIELDRLKGEKLSLEGEVGALKKDLDTSRNELEREVQRRVDLEQRFTEEAQRTTDQIEELIVKSDRDDAKLNELRRKFEMYSRETSSMIENFTTNREVLASQLLELRSENDYLLGQYLSKAHELQSAEIDLPQNIEELQFHCLTLNEKLILATTAKERLEETLAKNFSSSTSKSTSTSSTITPA